MSAYQLTNKSDSYVVEVIGNLRKGVMIKMSDKTYDEVFHQPLKKQQERIPCIAAFSFIKIDGVQADTQLRTICWK